MPTHQYPPVIRSDMLLAAAIALCKVHGVYYVKCFLEEWGADDELIAEFLDIVDPTRYTRR